MFAPAGDARKTIAFAMSSAVTKRLSDTLATNRSRMSSKLVFASTAFAEITRSMRAPATAPGRIALTRMPNSPSSIDSDFVKPTIAHFDDEIQQLKGLQADATDLRPGGARILRLALAQTLLSQNAVNTYWPPVVED